MAILQYSVWAGAAEVAVGPVIQENVITVSGTAASSDPINGSGGIRRRVRLMADVDCWVHWGPAVTALNDGTAGRMMGSENQEYFDITAGDIISVIERL